MKKVFFKVKFFIWSIKWDVPLKLNSKLCHISFHLAGKFEKKSALDVERKAFDIAEKWLPVEITHSDRMTARKPMKAESYIVFTIRYTPKPLIAPKIPFLFLHMKNESEQGSTKCSHRRRHYVVLTIKTKCAFCISIQTDQVVVHRVCECMRVPWCFTCKCCNV